MSSLCAHIILSLLTLYVKKKITSLTNIKEKIKMKKILKRGRKMNIRSAKEILEDLRKLSQIIVDLGYSAILQDDKELAVEANILKRKINELSYEIRLSIIYASKSAWTTRKEIEQLASVLQVGVAAKEISDGVEDLIAIVIRGKGVHPILKSVFGRDYIMKVVEVKKSISIKDMGITEEDKIDIEYLRRDDIILFGPISESLSINPKDIVLLSGSPEKVEEVTRKLT